MGEHHHGSSTPTSHETLAAGEGTMLPAAKMQVSSPQRQRSSAAPPGLEEENRLLQKEII